MTRASIHVGTSGWHYAHWRGRFYPQDLASAHWLAYYVERFGTVEINNSFYKLLTPAAVQTWYQATPRDFVFAVKASRYITHTRRLQHAKDSYQRFFDSIAGFGDKLGPILFQLPPHWHNNVQRLAEFLPILPRGYDYTFELRDPSWHNEEVYALLRAHRCAFCIFELAGFTAPLVTTTDFVYVRLHGPGGKYQGDYPARTLRRWAERARGWADEGKRVYVYFDNDQEGFAAKNALALKQRVTPGLARGTPARRASPSGRRSRRR